MRRGEAFSKSMCGIAGIVDPGAPAAAREEAVARMCAAMVHRGPDDSGIASSGPATLGMRRLAIFDPANGHQPMATPDGRRTIVFNGAIYNFRSLRAELESAGWAFRTMCDTEVLLAALASWGEGALGRLRGMFAFALWDSAEESLFAADDLPRDSEPPARRMPEAAPRAARHPRGVVLQGGSRRPGAVRVKGRVRARPARAPGRHDPGPHGRGRACGGVPFRGARLGRRRRAHVAGDRQPAEDILD